MSLNSEFEIENGVLVKYLGDGPEAAVPPGVCRIGDYSFQNCENLRRVFLPPGVTEIGRYAFSGCTGLEAAVIPDSLCVIEERAFYKCSRLEEAPLPPGAVRIGSRAFEHCGGLRRAKVPEGVSALPDGVFMWCRALAEVSLPSGLESIGDKAFSWCSSLEHIALPDSVRRVGDEAFRGCGALGGISLPGAVPAIGGRAFSGCRRLAGEDGLVIIDRTVYDYCAEGDAVTIPPGTKEIGSYAFYSSRNVSQIVFPDSLRRVGEYAFCGCGGLREVYISSLEAWCAITFSNMSANPLSCGAALNVNGARPERLELPPGLRRVKDFSFSGSRFLTSVTVPGSVVSVGACAFSECACLREAELCEGVKHIGKDAFYGCGSLKALSLPDSLRTVGERAFRADGLRLRTGRWTPKLTRALSACSISRIDTEDISPVPEKYKSAAALGFVSGDRSRISPLREAGHMAYLSKNAVRLCPLAFREPELLYFLCEKKLIKPGDLDLFLQEADRRGSAEHSALLLSYQEKLGWDAVQRARAAKERAAEVYLDKWLERSAQRQGSGAAGALFAAGGDLRRWSRRGLETYLRSHGASLGRAVTYKTDYYITNGTDAFSPKSVRAGELGVPALTEEELFRMCGP